MTKPVDKKTDKVRLDRMLVERGIAESREKAQAIIFAGLVLVDGRKLDKAGTLVSKTADLRLLGKGLPYVSRGGLKLEAALNEFSVVVEGKAALDVGASTGGFTDCLLQHGAREVYAVDVGYGQLAWKLRQDPRVIVIERTNICFMDPTRIPEPVDMAVIDVSFTSLEKTLPPVLNFLKPGAKIIALIKPQFEVGKGRVGKGGIVHDAAARAEVVDRIINFAGNCGLQIHGVIQSPITGQDGNVEYLLYATKPQRENPGD